ncbi:MAG TPA: hypothetical protein VMJ10_07565 [Kofleriaceae bacterium]|nr:hypothetical protein [Kofleriaceae bacterium]
MTIASAPGKLILAGEYAVLDGAPALVVAVDRRVVARGGRATGTSPFLIAVADELAARLGADHPAARAALAIAVDSSACYEGVQKLGLGSSAAVTVAATALALGSTDDRAALFEIAAAAHARAQRARGTPGSGADIAAAVYGGVISYASRHVAPLVWPAGVALVPFFTGVSAETVELVGRVAAARAANATAVDAALRAITSASSLAVLACNRARVPENAATGLLAALALAATAVDQLAVASRVPLVPACVSDARAALAPLGGTAKTTGAGGGDVAIAVVPAHVDRIAIERRIADAGGHVLALAIDPRGAALEAS